MEENNCPLVSVIMGAYNCENTVERAIESIIYQTYSNWEFLICDDCSTDHTFKILKEIELKDSRIKVLHNKKNRRLAYSLNHCLKYAHGKYIARMDADDISLPLRFEEQVSFLEGHPQYGVVGCSRIIFDKTGERYIRPSIEFPDKRILLKDTPFAHPTIMMRKEIYDDLNGYTVSNKTMRAEDLDLWFRFYAAGYQGYNIQEPLYKYQESIDDYKKRSLIAGIQTARVFLDGYQKLDFSKISYIMAIKPIIAALLPNMIMQQIHKK